jgi:alanine racemase
MTGAIYPAAPGASRRAWCEVDLAALRSNARVLRARAGVPLVPMIKADAYGHGAVAVAQALGARFAPSAARAFDRAPTQAADAVFAADVPWALGVATPDEAIALREAGATGRILCTTPPLTSELADLAAAGITPALHTASTIAAWRARTDAPWHLAIDTGMARAGVDWRAVAELRDVAAAHPPEGAFTHFHSADRPDGTRAEQECRFRGALATLRLPATVLRHAENSAALAALSPSPWQLARPGLALYGVAHPPLPLRAVLHVHARVIDVRTLEPGDTVSYGATWTASRPTRVATVPIGYGDGYPRAGSGQGAMLLRGVRVPVLGLVSMDMTMLDVTDVGGEVGDTVTALGDATDGRGTLPVHEVAGWAGRSPYELLVGWRLRLPRVYREVP